jgi:glutamate dehydrogenase
VPAEVQSEMLLSSRRSVERATRWLLRSRPRPLDIAAETERYAAAAEVVSDALPEILVEAEQQSWRERVAKLTEAGVPESLAGRVATQSALYSALDIAEVAAATERPVEEVAALHFAIGGNLSLHWLRDQIALLPRSNRWQAMARAALRDDLFSLHAELTAAVLRFGGRDAWMEANRTAVDRALEILGEIRTGGTFDLTTLPVALREVRNLIGRG